jgi:methionine sulfoxide reductase heme-binding subunit
VNQEFWYLSRAAGFTAYLLLFTSVALGIAIGTRLADRLASRNAIFDLHRFTTILALAFSLFHVYILLGDGYFNFSVWQLSIPFLSPYSTWQTAVGVFSLYVLTLLIVSFYVRRFIGYRAWRTVHFATFAMFAGVTLHGITAGTDTTQAWAKLIYLSTGTITLGLIMYRVQYRIPDTSTMRTVRLTAGIAAVSVVALLLFATGLFSSRSRASATQADVVSNDAAPVVNTSTGGAHPFLATFDNDFNGTYQQTNDTSGSRLVIDGTTDGDLPVKLHVELVQTASSQPRERSTVTVNTAELRDTASSAVLCTGQLTALDDGFLRATCDGSGPYQGVRISISSRLQASGDGTITGALSGNMQHLS